MEAGKGHSSKPEYTNDFAYDNRLSAIAVMAHYVKQPALVGHIERNYKGCCSPPAADNVLGN